MSGLQNFLAPFSHLLFSNRNLVIFFLCVVLFLAALDALIHRWKTQRLDRDLSAAKSSGGYSNSGRRYAATPAAEEPPREQGGALPPIKGGRTYARNLGSALQKAGVPTSQIYSPPPAPGWATNANPGQPGQPAAPPYPAPATPWGAPAAPQTPWAFQGGPGRPAQGPPPSVAPMYQPQPSAPPPIPQPSTPSVPGPGIFSPPSPAPGSFAPPLAFGQPAFPIPATGSSAPPPPFAPPSPSTSPMMPAFPAPPAPEPAASDGARRGKPKRRRFNFNVLENLEKIVQPRPSEPLPTSGWTPPPAPPAAAAAPPAASPPVGVQTPPAPPASPAPAAPTGPADQPSIAAKAPSPEPATLPFQFASQPEPKASPATEQPAEDIAAPATEDEVQDLAPSAPAPGPSMSEPDTYVEPEPEQKTDARRSMRSMMFGEEVAAPEAKGAAAAEPEVAPAPAPEQEPAPSAGADSSGPAVEPSWPSYSWNRREEASSSTEAVATPETAPTGEPAEAEAQEAPPVAESTSDAFDPWTPSYTAEPETTTEPTPASDEPSATEATEPATSQTPDEPADAEGGKGNAGTLVIIEDDATAASYYATLFRGNGYRVEVANDGVSGVDLATRMQPQVILLDVMMPRQNGILVLQTLRASDETKNTPVVVMSNFSEPTLIKRALQLGALEYVIKTQVEGPALLSALPRWMNREKAFAAA